VEAGPNGQDRQEKTHIVPSLNPSESGRKQRVRRGERVLDESTFCGEGGKGDRRSRRRGTLMRVRGRTGSC